MSSGLIPFALGCDGGGSIRLPAAWCGVYGLKTTHGRVSTRPYLTPAKSTSVAGPIAANMIDLEVSYRVMAKPDPQESTSAKFPSPTKNPNAKAPRKLGIYKKWLESADGPVKATVQKAIDYFTSKLGYEVVDITIPHLREAQMAHAITIVNEATSSIPKSTLKQLAAPNQILITVGRQASATDFLAAQRLRNLLMQHVAAIFKEHPDLLIITPTTPNAGWPIHASDSKTGVSDTNQSIRNMEYVWLANFCGLPSITVPVGYVDAIQGDGPVPIGLMATSVWGGEDELIKFGYEAEEYLHGNLEGGRKMPSEWLDVFSLLEKTEEKVANGVNGVGKDTKSIPAAASPKTSEVNGKMMETEKAAEDIKPNEVRTEGAATEIKPSN